MTALLGEKLFQAYNGAPILHGADIAVDAGGVTALLGKSGSGKSTLMRTLGCIDPPTSGTVSFNGQAVDSVTVAHDTSIWPDVTVVFQEFQLWPHLTLRQNVTLPADLRGRSGDVAAVCRLLALDGLLQRYPHEVGVGQRQRATLARALLLEPKILLLDEITSAQDVEHIARLREALSAAVRGGMGLLMITHHLGFAREMLAASNRQARVVFLEHGAVAESGGPECLDAPRSAGLHSFVQLSRDLA